MSRPALDPEEKKKLVNFKLPPATISRLELICFRRAVHRMKRCSQAVFIEEKINSTRLPKPPTLEQIAAFKAKYPDPD